MTEPSMDNNSWTLSEEQNSMSTSGSSAWNNAPIRLSMNEPFKADRQDGLFAVFAFVLGFLFSRWVLFSWQGWGVTLFTMAYGGVVTLYLLKKGVRIPRAGWFWMGIVAFTGISYSLWTSNGLEPWRSLLLFCSAIYWIICATGLPILGKTSNWMMLDGLNGLFVIPFKNFGSQYKSLAFLCRDKHLAGSQIFSILFGLFLALILAIIILPLLLQADSGGFARVTSGIQNLLLVLREQLGEDFVHVVLAIPIAAYLFGLVAGSVHKRGCDTFEKVSVLRSISSLRIIPAATVYTMLGVLCSLYVVFIGSQLPYFFSAFFGQRPEGWQVYSEYARSGFFELCGIAAINLSVLLAANLFCVKRGSDSIVIKVLNALLAILTLILIATALSKMAMYIGAYGLLMRRLLPCFFMILLAVVCGGVVALQKWQFSIVRLATGAAVVMLGFLCLADPDAYVARYNADRYLTGTLNSFDVEILDRSGPAGVDAALKVYSQTSDPKLQAQLQEYLAAQQQQAAAYAGQHMDNLQRAHARQKTGQHFSSI